ncbi:ATP-binding protein [Actinomadura sp. WAC 06369]|nr:ATP-binding protein [Actinomadura sp. WAC 06369]
MRWRRVFSGRVDQVQAARTFAGYMFAGTGREGDVAVVVTELATNAILHTKSGGPQGWFGLELTLADVSYVAVTDQGGGSIPTVQVTRAEAQPAEDGRGLFLVSQLAIATGIYGSPKGGHTVWADVDLRGNGNASSVRRNATLAS